LIKLILIDDHTLVRTGMRHMLEEVSDIHVLGEASTGEEGIRLARRLQPDVIILDFRLPDLTGLEVTQKLIQSNADFKILIVSAAMNDLFPFRLLEAGARGYLTKDTQKEELVDAVKLIHSGQRIINPKIASRLALAKIDYKTDSAFGLLSEQEMEVMKMLIRSVSIKDIGEHLNISTKTVHSYRSRIFKKLNVKSDIGLALLAIRHGLITLDNITTE